MTPADPIALARRIAILLDDLDIVYVIGGSVAASLYGEPRSTLDVGVMIRANQQQAISLTRALKDGFYVSEEERSGQCVIRRLSTLWSSRPANGRRPRTAEFAGRA